VSSTARLMRWLPEVRYRHSMGYQRTGFVFAGKGYVDADVGKRWLSDDIVTRVLLAPLERGGYLARPRWVSRDLGEPEPIGSMDELRARAATWGLDLVSLFAGDRDDPDWEIFLGLETVGPRISVGIPADGAGASLRDDVASWVQAWSEGLAAVGVRFATGSFAPARQDYPRPRPPRSSGTWPLGALDQYAGLTWHRARADRVAVLAGLEQAPLPPGAHRTVDGDVLRIGFDADLADPAAVAAARAAHERWFTPLVPTAIEVGWNEHGDRAAYPARPTVREPFTLYDEQARIGYKALAVFPDGSLDEAAWAQLAAVARAGALPDGTPVASVRLILPRREDALALHERALADGFEMTTYPAGKMFWQVDPP